MLNCAEQGHMQKYKTHAYKPLKTAAVKTSILKRPTKQLKKHKQTNIKPKYRINVHINNPNHTN